MDLIEYLRGFLEKNGATLQEGETYDNIIESKNLEVC